MIFLKVLGKRRKVVVKQAVSSYLQKIYNHPTTLNTVKRLKVKYDCLESVKTNEVTKSFSSYETSHPESKLLEINVPNGRRFEDELRHIFVQFVPGALAAHYSMSRGKVIPL